MNDFPRDFARPRDPERARFVANIVVGGVLFALCAAMLTYALLLP